MAEAWTREELLDLPGGELVVPGLEDLRLGVDSVAALLVAMAAGRLRDSGLDVPKKLPSEPEITLFLRLGAEVGNEAHSRYNALVRRLISFEQALERRRRGR